MANVFLGCLLMAPRQQSLGLENMAKKRLSWLLELHLIVEDPRKLASEKACLWGATCRLPSG